jgi:hypothetical protein
MWIEELQSDFWCWKAKKISRICIHQHVLLCTLRLTMKAHEGTNPTASTSVDKPQHATRTSEQSIGHISTIKANLDKCIPAVISPEILKRTRQIDAATLLNTKEVN